MKMRTSARARLWVGGIVGLALVLCAGGARADLTGHWVADDLDDGDVFGWINRVEAYNSALVPDGGGDPSAVSGALNGHKVVSFDGNDRFQVDAGAGNPMANVTSFSITTVFRTNTVGGGSTDPNVWWSNAGLVSMELPGGVNDWGFVLNPNGQVVAGIGGADRGITSAGLPSLADGNPHVASYVRTGNQIRLYVDTHYLGRLTGVASSARADQPFSIASAQTFDGGGAHFTGDIAEIQIENMALADDGIAALHNSMVANYGIVIPPPPPPPPPVPSGLRAHWSADDLLDDTGSPVNSWVDRVAGRPAAPRAGGGVPSLIENSPNFNGHNAISFNKAELDQLRVSGANSPMALNEDFTVALVFRTETAGVGAPGSQWWSNTGLVDAEQPGGTADWGITFNNAGQVGGGIGGPDVTINSVSELNDGNPHIVIYSYNSLTGQVFLTVDDVTTMGSGAAISVPRNVSDMVFGAIQTNEPDRHFSGEIADVRVWGDFFDAGRTEALRSELHRTYVIPEPSTVSLAAMAAVFGGLAWVRRRRAA